MRKNLGEILQEAGVITREDWVKARGEHQQMPEPRPPVQKLLIESGAATDVTIAKTLSKGLQLPYIDLLGATFDPSLAQMVPRRFAERHHLMPVATEGGELLIAMADPTNVLAIDDVRMAARATNVRVGVAPLAAIQESITRLYSVEKSAAGILTTLAASGEVEDSPADSMQDEEVMGGEDDDDPVAGSIVPLTNALVADAVRAGATDVHVEPTQDAVEVRYRVDGLLRVATTLPKHVQGQVITRLKIMAGMDIAQRRSPQDGRSKIHVDGMTVDTRVSTIPTISGEKVVIRILSNGGTGLDVKKLGFLEKELNVLQDQLLSPQGLIIFTGPTGSGKTSTMYSALGHIQSSEQNIITLEDPIEYRISGLNQVQINNKAGITFAAGLRSILRQDPDVIMVGEIRDFETAETVIQSSLTGHLVLSSLHTNDAPSVISRLKDLGVEPFLIASALTLVIAQRLVRSICEECKEEAKPSDRTLSLLGITREEADAQKFMKGAGCHACGQTGYRGRTGLYEVLPVTEQLRQVIGAGGSEAELDEAVRDSGLVALREVGVIKARLGLTTLEEVLRVTHSEVQGGQHVETPREIAANAAAAASTAAVEQGSAPEAPQAYEVEATVEEVVAEAVAEAVTAPVAEVVAEPAHEEVTEQAETSDQSLVLLIDDDADLRSLARIHLEDRFEIFEASSGEEGIDKATALSPDAIVLDHRLPGLSGMELVRRLREGESTKTIPLVMITGFADSHPDSESLAAAVDAYVMKPFNWDDLAERIAAVIATGVTVTELPEAQSTDADDITVEVADEASDIDLESGAEVIVLPEEVPAMATFDQQVAEAKEELPVQRSEVVYEEGAAVIQHTSHTEEEVQSVEQPAAQAAPATPAPVEIPAPLPMARYEVASNGHANGNGHSATGTIEPPAQETPAAPAASAPKPAAAAPAPQPAGGQPMLSPMLFGPLFDRDWTEEEWAHVLQGLIAAGLLSWTRLGSFVIGQQVQG